MGFLNAILNSIPEDQKSGLEGTMDAMVKGLAGGAGALEAIHAIGASMGNHGITVASESASNAAAPMNVSSAVKGIDV